MYNIDVCVFILDFSLIYEWLINNGIYEWV